MYCLEHDEVIFCERTKRLNFLSIRNVIGEQHKEGWQMSRKEATTGKRDNAETPPARDNKATPVKKSPKGGENLELRSGY